MHTIPWEISNPVPNNLPNKDRWSCPSHYRPSPSSPEAKRTKKNSKKEAPRKKHLRKEESEEPQVGLEAPGLAHQAEGVLVTDLSEQHTTAAHHASEGRVFPPTEVVRTEVRRFLFTSPPTTAAILCSHAFPPPPRAWQPFVPESARADALGNMCMRSAVHYPHPLLRAEVVGGVWLLAE